ncbi:MAG: hypothetical protein HYX27_05655 [Acidobacteria bacterium]|nr:hypothetical protein [Acidobacteriota bacterium]
MKRFLAVGFLPAVVALSLFGAEQTWTGEISDDMCGNNHGKMGAMGKNAKDCTAGCVKAGSKYVLVSHGKVFKIENQGLKDLAMHAGMPMKITGELSKDGQSVKVSKIEPTSMKK